MLFTRNLAPALVLHLYGWYKRFCGSLIYLYMPKDSIKEKDRPHSVPLFPITKASSSLFGSMYGLHVYSFVCSSILLSIVGAGPAPAPLSLPSIPLNLTFTPSNSSDNADFEAQLQAILNQHTVDSSTHFPAGAWLGQGLNMMTVLPTDIQSVFSETLSYHSCCIRGETDEQ